MNIKLLFLEFKVNNIIIIEFRTPKMVIKCILWINSCYNVGLIELTLMAIEQVQKVGLEFNFKLNLGAVLLENSDFILSSSIELKSWFLANCATLMQFLHRNLPSNVQFCMYSNLIIVWTMCTKVTISWQNHHACSISSIYCFMFNKLGLACAFMY